MKYKVYTINIKLAVVNDKVIKKIKTVEIKTKYQLSTRSLIYNWIKKYQRSVETHKEDVKTRVFRGKLG